uniref:Ubiquitin-like domain-containing protein n=1 Tax=Pyrodinium bahamense TaxID=73915 RepID=A0A7S0AJX7_9DINO
MAIELHIGTLAGSLCNVSLPSTSSVLQLKAAVERAEGIPAREQKLFRRQGRDLDLLQNDVSLEDCDLADGAEVTLVRTQPYSGRYKAESMWNGAAQLEILGSHAKVFWGEKGFEADIHWDDANPRKAKFEGRHYATTIWAKYHTQGEHKEEDGLLEKFSLVFNSETGRDGFTGIFWRQHEGPARIIGTLVNEEVEH